MRNLLCPDSFTSGRCIPFPAQHVRRYKYLTTHHVHTVVFCWQQAQPQLFNSLGLPPSK